MKTIFRTSIALALLPAFASAQILVPLAQNRNVSGSATADDGGTFLSDSSADSAVDFTPFISTAGGMLSHPDFGASGGSSQNSTILPDSFSGSGSGFADTFVDAGGWNADSGGGSLAQLDFQVTSKVQYRLSGLVSAFDNGFAEAQLRFLGGSLIAGDAAFGGDVPIIATGILAPGSYRVCFRASAGASSFGSGFDFGFGEYNMTLELTPFATNYCVAGANSVGPGAQLAMGGSSSIASNDFRIEATGVKPNVFGIAFYGPNQVQTAFGDGFRCVGGQTHRVPPVVQADSTGFASKRIDFTLNPAASGSGQILPMSTWNFQFWYRDPMGPGGTGFNTSDGLSVVFCP